MTYEELDAKWGRTAINDALLEMPYPERRVTTCDDVDRYLRHRAFTMDAATAWVPTSALSPEDMDGEWVHEVVTDPHTGFNTYDVRWVPKKKTSTGGCSHEYKTYTGFTEVYDYCTKCDHKKRPQA
jgi:hypothetical protein